MEEIFVPTDLGTTPDHEFKFLGEVVRGMDFPEDHYICEIGSLIGKSTITMALVARHKIVSIDPHEGPWETFGDLVDAGMTSETRNRRAEVGDTLEPFKANLEKYGVTDKVQIVQGYSDQVDWAMKAPICLLFLDGDHSYLWVKHDYEKFSKHVCLGGLIAFHDYKHTDEDRQHGHIGVAKAVDEILAREPAEIEIIGHVGSLVVCQKVGP